jgi:hypothetical protein
MATLAQHNFPQSSSSLPSSFDEDLDSLIPASTESTALLLQGVVSMEKISDSIAYMRVVAAGTDAATNIKSIESLFKPITEQRYAHWKRATELRGEKLKPFEAVKKKASLLVGAYELEQEQSRRAEEARLQAEENARAVREQQEQSRLAASEARRISEEQALADAVELEAAGDHAGAEAVLNNPVPVSVYVPPVYASPVILEKSVPKVKGKSSVTEWGFRVKVSPKCRPSGSHNPEECSVCLEEVPREYLVLNSKLVGQLVRALKDKTSIPGIDVAPVASARFKG